VVEGIGWRVIYLQKRLSIDTFWENRKSISPIGLDLDIFVMKTMKIPAICG
jgi:hypothetical protein